MTTTRQVDGRLGRPADPHTWPLAPIVDPVYDLMSDMAIITEWELPRQDGLRGLVLYNPEHAEVLLPPDRFSDDYVSESEFLESRAWHHDVRDKGLSSKVLRMRMASSTAGWRNPSSGEELYHAIHALEPTARQTAVVRSWEAEVDDFEIFEAYLDQAYSFRVLAAALHRSGLVRCKSAAFLNKFALPSHESV